MGHEVLLVEDDERFGLVVSALLEAGSFRVHRARDARDARRIAKDTAPGAMVVDLGLPDCDGIDLVRELALGADHPPILVLTSARAPSAVVSALRAGASGYLYKEDVVRRLVAAMDELLAGGAPLSGEAAQAVLAALRGSGARDDEPGRALTAREREVLAQLARGLTYEQVASVLEVSVNTVRTHVKTIYEKLDASTRTEAVLTAVQKGLLRPS